MPIGQCDHCGRDIVAPQDVLVWAEDRTYHKDCYRERLEEQITVEVAAV
jgi:hypothetical protein